MLTDAKEDYMRGFVPFLGQTIFLDSKPLIPRTETEWWVDKALKEVAITAKNHSTETPLRILDLFSGSGCIGIAALAHIPNSIVTFGEKETRHLGTIKKSIEENGLDSERTSVVQTNIWSGIAGPFECVFANPPYVSKKRQTVSDDTQHLEPHEALFADDDGFLFIEKTIEKLPQFLVPSGVCFIEHEPFHKERILGAAAKRGLNSETFPDQYGTDRYSRLSMA